MVIKGDIINIIYRNSKTGYTVGIINTEEKYIKFAGISFCDMNKKTVELTGDIEGEMFRFINVYFIKNEKTAKSILSKISGLGTKTISKIFSLTKLTDLFGINESTEIEYVALLCQVSKEKAKLIKKSFAEFNAWENTAQLTKKYKEISVNTIHKLVHYYKDEVEKQINENPYKTLTSCGVNFYQADAIAKDLGFSEICKERINCAIKISFYKLLANGHTYTYFKNIIMQTKKMTNTDISIINNYLLSNEEYINDNNRYFPYKYFEYEISIAYSIKKIMENAIHYKINPEEICNKVEDQLGIKYAPEQRKVFELLQYGGICVLTGGPGTGKTTTIQGFLKGYQMIHKNATIKLCAPTGRAAQRMTETTGMEAVTIHKLCDFRPFENGVLHKNEFDPIDCDLLIVDEASMCDINITKILLSALTPKTFILFTGDINQLPSVGAGNVLNDLLKSNQIPTIKLIKTYRQSTTSLITQNALLINKGNYELLTGQDFEIIKTNSDSEMVAIAENIFKKYYSKEDPFEFQILAPSKKNAITGTCHLNDLFQNLREKKANVLTFGKQIYYVGDKVMMIKNNYSLNYYNGDIGIISSIQNESCVVTIGKRSIKLNLDNLQDMSLAYITTIHKSQGSEYKTIIILLPESPQNMLQRNLLYTAVTRAKEKCILICSDKSLKTAVKTTTSLQRRSGLSERIIKQMEDEK